VSAAKWTFSDGLEADALQFDAMIARTLDVPGRLTGALTVTDEAGLSCHASAAATATSVGGSSPPVIVSVPPAAGQCGTAWTYQPSAVGSAPISWALGKNAAGAGHPSGMTIDEATGAITWTPDTKTRGPTRVTLVASNEAGTTEQDFLVEVECAKGCGCGSGAGVPLLLLAVALARRRRTQQREPTPP